MQQQLAYNQFIGLETNTKEYKAPSMSIRGNSYIDDDILISIKTNIFNFNKAIKENIITSMTFYFLKYFTAFLNSVDIESAELYYGVDDYGIVTGFPYKGKYDICELKTMFDMLIDGDYFDTINDRTELKNCYTVELLQVKYKHTDDTNYHQIYETQENDNKQKMTSYQNEFMLNMRNHHYYSTKLINIIRNPVHQKDFLKYIYNKLEYRDISLYRKLARKIRNNDYIEKVTYQQIKNFKNDNTSVYYWLTRFKDERIKFLKILRPVRPPINRKIQPSCLINTIKPMIPNWMNNNSDMNLYVIKLSFFPEKFAKRKKDINYKHNGVYNYCVRILDDFGNPCCTPY